MTGSLILPELEHLYRISQLIFTAKDWKQALDEATFLVRSMLIFDNLVVYLRGEDDVLDVMYAKAMGRGKSAEADIAWGEDIANQIIQDKELILREPPLDPDKGRLERPFILGIPLDGQSTAGALLLIRFGGPAFQPEHIQLARFIAQQVTQMIDRQHHLQIEKLIQDQDKQIQLQKDFISTISHELRSPLGFIKGYTTTLLRDDTSWDKETQLEFLQIIDQETDHLQELIDNLLDSSRLQAGLLKMKYQHVRLDTLIKDVIARESMHHPDLIMEINSAPELRPIKGDPYRLAQVIENIVSNAVKYAPGSKIWVTINQEENQTQINVADEGPGIPEKYINHIFERFFRNPDQSPNIHGSGLGLFICKQIIEAHQGQIFAKSKLGQGTTVCINLPNQPELT
jgi:signal transduction histidine kinase